MRAERVRLPGSWAAVAVAVALAGCVSLAPRDRRPALPVADQWPIAATTAVTADAATPAAAPASTAGAAPATVVADIGWRDFFIDDKLRQIIALALQNNRDLRVAVASIDRARAQYHIQRADRVPSIVATGSGGRTKSFYEIPGVITAYPTTSTYTVGLGVSAFELDLFDRVHDLSRSALEQYLSQEETRRSAQLSLIAEVASTYLTLAADRQLQQLADDTRKNQEDAYRLAQQRYQQGAISGLDLAQSQTTVEAARADAARYEGNTAKDIDALAVLVGTPLDAALLPAAATDVTGVGALPPGLPSQVLLRRPDVLSAEHTLRAANANIGAARAAFFPHISLTGNFGTASGELSGLFKAGTSVWSFTPQVSLPIFEGGRLIGGLGVANANRDIAVAQYEKAIQTGFQEVADGLALTGTLARQLEAQEALATASARAYDLSQERYKAGRDSYLNVLDAQRSNYTAQQGLISVRLAEQTNRITLYKALGGGWQEHSP
jgi:multidrug efflux system outer membrane protein